MPSSRLPLPRRPVAARALLIGLVGLLGLVSAPAAMVAADPYGPGSGPVLTVPSEAIFVLGVPGEEYSIEADGYPVPVIGADHLPPGLRLTAHGDGSATLSGTPTGPAGPVTVVVHAQNAMGVDVAALTLVVQQTPAFVGSTALHFIAGEYASALVRSAGYPAPGISVEGDLPAGLTFTDNGDGTATIAGTPVGGPTSTPLTLTAVNVVADVTQPTTIQVTQRPAEDDPAAVSAPALTSVIPAPRREP